MTEPLDSRAEGGCACGRLRYAITEAPFATGYCHCRLCQRTTGAPVLAWAIVPATAFRWLTGEPARYPSSDHGTRQFCSHCGAQLAYLDARDPDSVSINSATLDDPAAAPPTMHVWTQSRLPWFDTADGLPRYPDGGPQPNQEEG